MSEWWINEVNENMLTIDENSRVRLPDDYILNFLTMHEAARKSYLRLLPKLTLVEQDRLLPLYTRAVQAVKLLDEKSVMDRVQNKWNRAGVYTAGPRGGTRAGGN